MLVLVSFLLAACSSSGSSGSSAGSSATNSLSGSSSGSSTGASHTVWLCRPGLANDPCTADLTTTVTSVTGASGTEDLKPAESPPIDCFYVYPTVSSQPTANANLHIDPEEIGVAQQQASQFSRVCRVFAPMYRQLTLKAITSPNAGLVGAAKIAYDGVLSAWRDYLAHDNGGRGVVLIGHSQGAGMLTQLIRSQIDTNAGQRRLLVSAILMGGNIVVPAGRDVGGVFQHVPACRSNRQTGCVVAYSTFDQTPPANSLFGRPRQGASLSGTLNTPNPQILCTNPAELSGGGGSLRSMFRRSGMAGVLGTLSAAIFGGHPPVGSTPWVEWDGWYTARCVNSAGANVLSVTPEGGAPALTPEPDPTWGLHLIDVNITLGNLVDVVSDQSSSFRP